MSDVLFYFLTFRNIYLSLKLHDLKLFKCGLSVLWLQEGYKQLSITGMVFLYA